MKKLLMLIFAIHAITGFSNAQKSKLVGSWLMIKAEVGDKIENPFFVTDFNEDGKMTVMGMDAGTWEYNKTSNSIIMKSELDKDFNGEGKIVSIKEKELVVDKDGTHLYYQKVNTSEIMESNKNSGLFGTWEFEDVPYPDVNTLVTFSEPDAFKMIQKDEYSSSTLNGTWIFGQTEKSLIMVGLRGEDFLKGESKVIKTDGKSIELEFNGTIFKGVKKAQNTRKIEHLVFSENEFYNEDGDYKYYDDEEKLPWRNWSEMKMSLLNVQQLVYNFYTLTNGSETFETKTFTADVKATLEEEGFNIDNIFNGYDRYNLPEDAEFYTNSDYSKPLYPLDEDIFRVVGNEQITTPAGTFDCTVVEAVKDSEILKKLWMISDKVGVYAKIIEENPDETWGHYSIYELQEIK